MFTGLSCPAFSNFRFFFCRRGATCGFQNLRVPAQKCRRTLILLKILFDTRTEVPLKPLQMLQISVAAMDAIATDGHQICEGFVLKERRGSSVLQLVRANLARINWCRRESLRRKIVDRPSERWRWRACCSTCTRFRLVNRWLAPCFACWYRQWFCINIICWWFIPVATRKRFLRSSVIFEWCLFCKTFLNCWERLLFKSNSVFECLWMRCPVFLETVANRGVYSSNESVVQIWLVVFANFLPRLLVQVIDKLHWDRAAGLCISQYRGGILRIACSFTNFIKGGLPHLGSSNDFFCVPFTNLTTLAMFFPARLWLFSVAARARFTKNGRTYIAASL